MIISWEKTAIKDILGNLNIDCVLDERELLSFISVTIVLWVCTMALFCGDVGDVC